MLEIANLSHTYANGTVALDDVNLSIPRGMFGLLGPNGAGKSTLMRTVATLQAPTAGSIKFGDIDVLAEPERLRRTLGYLPQDFGVYPRVSAYAMLDQMAVLKGITGKGERKSVVETLLQQTNLWAVRDKSIAGFSGCAPACGSATARRSRRPVPATAPSPGPASGSGCLSRGRSRCPRAWTPRSTFPSPSFTGPGRDRCWLSWPAPTAGSRSSASGGARPDWADRSPDRTGPCSCRNPGPAVARSCGC